MKKFTKGCLITALILFIIGCIFCLTFGTLGGFRQIDSKAYRKTFSFFSAATNSLANKKACSPFDNVNIS